MTIKRNIVLLISSLSLGASMRRMFQIGIASIAIAIILCAQSALAQNANSGDIRGTVTDSSGALIPNVTVMALDVDTGVAKTYVTDQAGLYDTAAILPGNYKLTFTKQGFETLVRGPVTLPVGYITVDATLKVGSTVTQVTVTTNVPLLQTESGDQTAILESGQLTELPTLGMDWEPFMILLPGSSGAASNGNTANPETVAAVDGNLPYTNVLDDGSSIIAAHSDNTINSQGEIESISELQVSESSYSAQYGIGGLIINKITKSGTDKFHGDVYENFMNNFLNSHVYSYSGTAEAVPVLRWDEFGGSIGGPILKKKMFFFFNIDEIVDHGASGHDYSTVPTADIMAGNFSSISLPIYDPTTQTIAYDSLGNPYPVRQSFLEEYGSNAIPSGMIDTVAKAAQAYYPTPSNHEAGGTFVPGTLNTLGVLQDNWFATLPNISDWRRYVGRLDYDITPTNRFTASVSNLSSPAHNLNALTACPIGCQQGSEGQEPAEVSDVWNISRSTINEARFGWIFAPDIYPGQDVGKGYPAAIGWQFSKADQFPGLNLGPSVAGSTGPAQQGNYASLEPGSNSYYKQQTWDPSDVVTMIRGKNILHFGGEFLFYRQNDTNWGNIAAGTLDFDGRYTRSWSVSSANCPASAPEGSTCAAPNIGTTGFDYADFLLGLSNGWGAAVSREFGARMKAPDFFFQDDYKVRPNLTVNIGLRYEISHGWNEVRGNEMDWDPTVLNPATSPESLGALWFGTTKANGRTSLQKTVLNTFLPRFGFSWQLNPNTTFRGGAGLYDHIMSLDYYGQQSMGAATAYSGSLGDTTNGIWSLVQLDGTGTVCGQPTSGQSCSSGSALPYITPNGNPAALNGENVAYIPYHAPIQKIAEYNMSVQRMLRTNLMAEVAYVGSYSWNLVAETDLNAVPASHLSANDTAYRPYPLFESIAAPGTNNGEAVDGVANYNSLQAMITQRMTSGLSFSFNYVWSHFLDDMDSAGWCCNGGVVDYQIPNDTAADYSNSNFDVRQAFKGYAVYQLPFGKGMQFLNNNSVADAVIGGWQISGTLIHLTGSPYTVRADGNTYNLAAGSTQFPNWNTGVSPKVTNRTHNEWFNPEAFTKPANGTYGNVRRNSLYGPGLSNVNLSGSKSFSLPWEGVKLQIRIDANNAFNHSSFATPGRGDVNLISASGVGTAYTGPVTGQITSSAVSGRAVQLAGRLSF